MTVSLRTAWMASILCSAAWADHAAAQQFQVGDRVEVTATTTSVMAGKESRGSIRKGTAFAVEELNGEGAWLKGTFTINGRQASGWVKAADVGPAVAAAPEAAPPAQPRSNVDFLGTLRNNYRRVVTRYDSANDEPQMLYGTFTIRQGMTKRITPQMAGQDYVASMLQLMDEYYGNASWGFDPSVVREPGTKELLALIPAEVTLGPVLQQVRSAVAAAAPIAEEDLQRIDSLRREVTDLRGKGQYAAAATPARQLEELCVRLYGPDSWQTGDARRLVATLAKAAALPSASQARLAQTDRGAALLPNFKEINFRAVRAAAADRAQVQASLLGADHPETLASQAWLPALDRLYGGERLETTHVQMLDRTRKQLGDNHPATARCLNNLALMRHDRTDFAGAEKILLYALSIRNSAGQRPAADSAWLLMNLARVYQTNGKQTDAESCRKLSREIVRSLSPDVRAAVARAAFDDFAPFFVAESGRAPFYLRSGLANRPAVINHLGYGGVDNLGLTGDSGYKTPETDFDALSMQKVGGGQGGYPHQAYADAARAHVNAGDYAAAERFQRKAVEVAREFFKNKPDVIWHLAIQLTTLATNYELSGKREQAVPLYVEACAILKPRWEAEWKKGYAAFQGGTSQYFAWSDYTLYAQALMAMGANYSEMGRLEEAEATYRQALAVAKAPYTIDKRASQAKLSHAPQATVDLAEVLRRRGKLEEAEQLYTEVVRNDLAAWAFSPWTMVHFNTALSGLASLTKARGDADSLARSQAMLCDAMLIATHNGAFVDSVSGGRQMLELAAAVADTGSPAEAALLLEWAARNVEEQRTRSSGDEISRAKFFSELTKYNPYSALVQLHAALGSDFQDHFGVGEFGPRAAFGYVELGRGRALLDLLSRGEMNVDELLARLQQQRRDAALDARIAALRDQARGARQRAAAATEELQGYQTDPRKLQALGTQGAASKMSALQQQEAKAQADERHAQQDLFDLARTALVETAPQPMSADQVGAALRPNELLLAYDVSAGGAVLLVAHPGGTVEGHRLAWPDGKPVTHDVLTVSIDDFFQEISREETPAAASQTTEIYFPDELRQALLPDPVLAAVHAAERVFVVADGPLHRLPLEALYQDENGDEVLVDKLPPLVYGASATVLLSSRTSPPAQSAPPGSLLVALGDPDFGSAAAAERTTNTGDSQTVKAVEARTRSLSIFGQLAPLPETQAEIDAIVKRLPKGDSQVRVLTGNEATISNLFAAVERPRFLHLATHGLAEGGLQAWESSLALAAPQRITAEDTGFLRLADLLYRWGGRLDGTELVVLSACRTARGELEAGDGFVALTWGFLYAGADNVVATLWEVDDTATALLMSRFYEDLLGSTADARVVGGRSYPAGAPLPAADALCEAKLWLRRLDRAAAEGVVREMLGPDARVPSGDHPFADPFYWGAFVLFGQGG